MSERSYFQIPCLQSVNDLKEVCYKMGLAYSETNCTMKTTPLTNGVCVVEDSIDGSDEESGTSLAKLMNTEEYEVEAVANHVRAKGITFYLIKWKGWSSSDNTWEPEYNLTHCKHLLKKYHQRTRKKSKDVHLRGSSRSFPHFSKLKLAVKLHSDFSLERSPSDRMTVEFLQKRWGVLQRLKMWQEEINSVTTERALIIVENNVDLEGPPPNFTYINDYKSGEGIVIPDDPLIGCSCEDCFQEKDTCCPSHSGGHFAYSKQGKLRLPKGSPVYECNKRCKCPPDCPNRVVQHGRKIKLAIFRTSNGIGWGVKTLQKIKKATFVMEYVGEVITTEEAEKRGKIYDRQGLTYLFDLDYNESDCPFTVDAAYYGNVSHFMNHSCNPNLIVYGVWINTLDARLPRIAFFAKRNIAKGEELTFDYLMIGSQPRTSKTEKKTPEKADESRIPCKCGASQCRKYLF